MVRKRSLQPSRSQIYSCQRPVHLLPRKRPIKSELSTVLTCFSDVGAQEIADFLILAIFAIRSLDRLISIVPLSPYFPAEHAPTCPYVLSDFSTRHFK